MINLEKITGIAWLYLKEVIAPGDVVIDATAGNGNDTVFLAELIGENGQVFAFDIQDEALKITKEKLKKASFDQRVTLICDSHEYVAKYVRTPIKAAVFNLGYLPGGDKNIITKPQSTIKALAACYNLLKPGGVITLTVYVGHTGGDEERVFIEQYLQEIPDREGFVIKHDYLNRPNTYPKLYLLGKRRNIV